MAPMKRVEFETKIHNRHVDGYVIFSDVTAWVWIGEQKVSNIGLAHFPLFSMLKDGDNTQQEFVKSVALRLTKKSKFTQVIFTTDIECEDGIFWKEINETLCRKLNEITSDVE